MIVPLRLSELEQMLPSRASTSTGLCVMKSHRSFRVWPVLVAKVTTIPSIKGIGMPAVIATPGASGIVCVGTLLNQLKVSGVPTPSIWTLKLLFAAPVKVPLDVMSSRPNTVPVADV